MSDLYRRVWALEVGMPNAAGRSYTGMDMSFRAVQSAKGSSLCNVTIWMPARELVDALNIKGVIFRVLAGYLDSGAVEVARGTVVQDSVRNKLAAAEPLISWQVSPSKEALARAMVARTWRSVYASEIIDHVRRSMGLAADVIDLPEDVFYAAGYHIEKPKPALDEVTEDCGAQWDIVDNRLRVWPIDGVAKRTADLWSTSNGVILESAAPNGDGKVTASALLRPQRRPGDTVRIESTSRGWSGDIRGQEFVHTGNTAAQVWRTDVTGVIGG